MANRYYVRVPLAGYCVVETVADSEKEAIENALADAFDGVKFECNGKSEIMEIDAYRALYTGNVTHAPVRHAEVESKEECDELE